MSEQTTAWEVHTLNDVGPWTWLCDDPGDVFDRASSTISVRGVPMLRCEGDVLVPISQVSRLERIWPGTTG